MLSEKIEKIRRELVELKDKDISICDLKIVYEIDCQSNRDLTPEEYNKLYSNVEYAYFKLKDVPLEIIVACGLENIDKLDDDDFDFREECCYYY